MSKPVHFFVFQKFNNTVNFVYIYRSYKEWMLMVIMKRWKDIGMYNVWTVIRSKNKINYRQNTFSLTGEKLSDLGVILIGTWFSNFDRRNHILCIMGKYFRDTLMLYLKKYNFLNFNLPLLIQYQKQDRLRLMYHMAYSCFVKETECVDNLISDHVNILIY